MTELQEIEETEVDPIQQVIDENLVINPKSDIIRSKIGKTKELDLQFKIVKKFNARHSDIQDLLNIGGSRLFACAATIGICSVDYNRLPYRDAASFGETITSILLERKVSREEIVVLGLALWHKMNKELYPEPHEIEQAKSFL